MNKYFVVYLGQDGKEVQTTVKADSVRCDPHWVSFVVDRVQETETISGCDNCGRGGIRRVSPRLPSEIAAIFPASRVRSVVKYDN